MRTTSEIKPTGLTFRPAAIDPLAAKKAARAKGSNDHTDELQTALDFLLANESSFDLQDFYSATGSLGLDNVEIRHFFNDAVQKLCKSGRLAEKFGCYGNDWPRYAVRFGKV